jgi:hypothetical protein
VVDTPRHTPAGSQHDRQVRPGLSEGRPDGWPARRGDGKREHGVQEEAGGGDRGYAEHERDEDGPAQYVEGPPVQQMDFQVEHGGPDPHRREHLD